MNAASLFILLTSRCCIISIGLRVALFAQIVGVGDRPSDLEAYTSTGLHACVVAHMPPSSASTASDKTAQVATANGAALAKNGEHNFSVPATATDEGAAGVEECWSIMRKARDREIEIDSQASRSGSSSSNSGSGVSNTSSSSGSDASALASDEAARTKVPPSVVYFTDCASVHTAAAANSVSNAAVATADSPVNTTLIEESRLDTGGISKLRLFTPSAANSGGSSASGAALRASIPPIWAEGHLLGYLKRLAAQHNSDTNELSAGSGDATLREHVGGADWEEEASATRYVKDRPRNYGRL